MTNNRRNEKKTITFFYRELLLTRYRRESNRFLGHVVLGNESLLWVKVKRIKTESSIRFKIKLFPEVTFSSITKWASHVTARGTDVDQ